MAYTTIDDPTIYFVTVIYTGNDTARTITTGLETTDWIWNKRTDSAGSHLLYDKVRGINIDLNSNSTEADETQTGTVTAFGTNSFSLGTHGGTNASGETKVNWCWSAGGTTGSSNSNGSITSTVSVNTTAGFSIVAYSGTTGGASSTIGHGLGQTPDLVILKPRSYSGAWWWAQKGRSDKVLELQANNAEVNPATSFGGGGLKYSTFTNSVFGGTNGTSNDDLWNTNGATYIAYCFAQKKGYSSFGSYTGNGNADGVFVYTGFRPAFVLRKRTDTANNWGINDNKRDTFNITENLLTADTTSAAGDGTGIDMLSNGFKMRTNGSLHNASGGTYIYMAFAESPFVNSKGIPTNAR